MIYKGPNFELKFRFSNQNFGCLLNGQCLIFFKTLNCKSFVVLLVKKFQNFIKMQSLVSEKLIKVCRNLLKFCITSIESSTSSSISVLKTFWGMTKICVVGFHNLRRGLSRQECIDVLKSWMAIRHHAIFLWKTFLMNLWSCKNGRYASEH